MREKGFLLLRLLFYEQELSNKTTTLTILQSNTKGRLRGVVFTHWGHKCSLGTSWLCLSGQGCVKAPAMWGQYADTLMDQSTITGCIH